MSCGEVQVRLADDVLGEASSVDHEALAEHLAGCAVCAEERRAFEEAIGVLREMDWPIVEPVLAAPQRARVEERAVEPVGRGRRRQVALISLSSLAAAAVMAAIAVPSLKPTRVVSPARFEVDQAKPQEAQAPLEYEQLRSTETTASPGADGRSQALTGGGRAPATPKKNEVAGLEVAPAGPGIPTLPPPTMAPEFLAQSRRGEERRALSQYAYEMNGGVEGGVAGGVVGGMPAPPPDVWMARESADRSRRLMRAQAAAEAPAAPGPSDMFFRHQGTNPFVATEQDSLSTFGLDVDTASYTVTRNYLTRGILPPASAVRVEEFVNAMPQDYAAPRREAFAIHVDAAPSPFRPGYHLLRVGLKAREVRANERKPANLTFVIDVSGSMARENRLELVKRSLRLLVDQLDERDRIGIVVYGTRGRVVLEPTPASDRREILFAIDSLRPEGSTNLEEGLDLGYRMAVDEASPRANNRVVLCTDGVANNGVTDANTLLRRIHERAQKRVFLTALGFGMGNYNDALLQRLADEGDGQHAYIDDDQEARRFFLRDLSGVLEVVARDAKAQVEFDPGAVESYRLMGFEKRDVADEDFRNDDVDGGEIGAGHAVTVLYELKLRGTAQRLGTASVRFIDPDSGDAQELSRAIEASDLRRSFGAAPAGFRVAVVAARFAEHLRASRWVRGEQLDDVLELAEGLPASALRGAEAADLRDLLRQAVALIAPTRLVPANRDRD